MSLDAFREYEEQYLDAVFTIHKNLEDCKEASEGRERRKYGANMDTAAQDALDAIGMMESETYGMQGSPRDDCKRKVRRLRTELSDLKKDIRKAQKSGVRQSLLGGPDDEFADLATTSADHRQRVLNTNRRLDGTGDTIMDALKISTETEQVGTGILDTLHSQKETILRTRDGLRTANSNVKRSRRTITSMNRRKIIITLILILVIIALVIFILFIVLLLLKDPLIKIIKAIIGLFSSKDTKKYIKLAAEHVQTVFKNKLK